MTEKQLETLESDLARHGYKKWTTCLHGREDYDWRKTFGKHEDADGETTCDYEIIFCIYKWCGKYPDIFNPPEPSVVWLTVAMFIPNLNNRLDCDYSLQIDVPDIDMCEAMMKEFFETAKRYLKER